jgi:tetratricopeptide (TPR) repeat protein
MEPLVEVCVSRPVTLGLVLFLLSLSGWAQRGSMSSDIELRIKISFDNDRPVGTPLRVQLLNGSENMVADTFSDGTGQAVFRSIRGGNYKVRVSGVGILETTSESFTIDPRDRFQVQYVHVSPAATTAEANGGQNKPISAAELNVPEKARKEFDRGTEAMGKSRWEEAEKHFEKATEIYPRYASAFNNLGVVAINRNNPPAAREYFQQAISLDDHLASAYLNISKLDYNEHRVKEAQTPLAKTLALDPMNVEAMLLMAATQLATGGFEEAITYAHKIHTLPHQKFAISHIIAARACEQSKKISQAIGEYQLYLQEAPQSPLAPGARDAMARLQRQH